MQLNATKLFTYNKLVLHNGVPLSLAYNQPLPGLGCSILHVGIIPFKCIKIQIILNVYWMIWTITRAREGQGSK